MIIIFYRKTSFEWNTEGEKQFKRQLFKESVDCFTKAIDMNPKESSFYENRARAYYSLKKYHDSIVKTILYKN